MAKFDIAHLASPQFRNDPYPTYETMRCEGGVHWVADGRDLRGSWLLTRYDDVARLLRSRETSKLPVQNVSRHCPYDHCLSTQDSPSHGRMKSPMLPYFSSRHIATLTPMMGQIVDTLLAPILASGGAEFVSEFAAQFPARVLSELLGIPDSLHARFLEWSGVVLMGHDMSNKTTNDRAEALMGLTNIARVLVMQRRTVRSDDLVATMVRSCHEDGELTEDELIGTLIQLMVVGHETTANMLASGLWLLLSREDAYRRVCTDLSRLPIAIEEILRFESPAQRLSIRTLLEPMTFGNFRIEAGDHVTAVIGSANRDPDQFGDPERFDIERQPNRHLAFGLGIHSCLAHSLARQQTRVALERICARAPHMRLDDNAPQWRLSSGSVRGLKRLLIKL